MSTLYDRLIEICRDHGIETPRPRDISNICGLSSGRPKQIKDAGGAAKLGADTLSKLVGKGYSPNWIQDGKGNKRLSPSSDTNKSLIQAQSLPKLINLSEHPDLVEVPRVKFKLSAGVSGYAVELESGNGKPVFFRKDWFDLHSYKPEKLFGVRVSGSSMEPSLWDGDLVVINTDDTVPHDGDVFAVNYEGELVIKRMRRDAGEWFAASDNADQRRFAPKRCTEDVTIIGRVIYKQSERI